MISVRSAGRRSRAKAPLASSSEYVRQDLASLVNTILGGDESDQHKPELGAS
jgi:hypothetical protein